MFTHHSGSQANGGCGDYRVPSLDAKSDCHQIRTNTGMFLSVLFWFTIFEWRSLDLIRFQRCSRRSTSELLIQGYNRIHRYYLEPGNYKTDNDAELLEENFGNDEENEDEF